jgi:hypothetical protein
MRAALVATTSARYNHAEAFALMTYQAEDGEREVIWNSRDGVTPFVIMLRSGKEARHVNWSADRRVLDYDPQPGERVFTDLTKERWRSGWFRNAERYWADQGETGALARQRWRSARAMAHDLMRDRPWQPGLPDLIEIGPGERLVRAGTDIDAHKLVAETSPGVVEPYVCKHGVPAPRACVQCMVCITGA